MWKELTDFRKNNGGEKILTKRDLVIARQLNFIAKSPITEHLVHKFKRSTSTFPCQVFYYFTMSNYGILCSPKKFSGREKVKTISIYSFLSD